MKKILITLLMSSTIGYGQWNAPEELHLYIHSFEKFFETDVDTKIEFGEFLGKGTAVSIKGKNHIVINRERWDKLDSRGRYFVMYHELGHAHFDMRHSKRGIMTAKPSKDAAFLAARLIMRKELKRIKKN